MNLLEKTRKINTLLQESAGKPIDFKKMGEILSEVIEANIFIVNQSGKLLGYAVCQRIENVRMKEMLENRQFPEEYIQELLTVAETSPNIAVDSKLSIFPIENKDLFEKGLTTIVPIIGGGERLGTLVLGRVDIPFEDEDLILAEYAATVVGMGLLRSKAEEAAEEARNKTVVQMAINSLSFSELEAIEHIFDDLEGTEGLLVASRIADRYGITRSVIVNALRKLESAGVIETRSLGMKGTYIKILNDRLLNELERVKSPLL